MEVKDLKVGMRIENAGSPYADRIILFIGQERYFAQHFGESSESDYLLKKDFLSDWKPVVVKKNIKLYRHTYEDKFCCIQQSFFTSMPWKDWNNRFGGISNCLLKTEEKEIEIDGDE